MDALKHLPEEVDHLLEELGTLSIAGHPYAANEFVLTNYIFFMLVAIGFLALFITIAVRRRALVPQGRIANAVEALVQFVRDDVVVEMIGPDGRRYFPFIATVFFFILFNNLLGLIPGCKPGTGTMGVTVAVSTTVFIFFNYVGFKNQGAGYLKSFSPHGVPFPVNILVWFIEVFSAFLRIFTLAVRLFANMYAGHIILGIFALLTSLFVEPAIHSLMSGHLTGGDVAGALPALGWLLLMTALYLLEVLVAFVQAYVFTLLTTVYIQQAAHAH